MAIKLPYQQTTDRLVNQFQQALAKALQPVTSSPLSEVTLLTEVSLASGANIIPTTINRNLTGWIITRQRAQADIWDTQDTNPTPSQTLILHASTAVVVDILVF